MIYTMTQKERGCAVRLLVKSNYCSLPLRTETESASVKRLSHKSFHNIAEAYNKDRASLNSISGTTSIHLSLDLNCTK